MPVARVVSVQEGLGFLWSCGTCDTIGTAWTERAAWSALDEHVDGDASPLDRVQPLTDEARRLVHTLCRTA